MVAQADAPADHVEARETGARCRSVQAGLAGVEPQAQVCQIAGQGTQAVVDGVEVQIGEELAGEIADRQAAGPLQGGEEGVAGEAIERGAVAGAVGEDAIKQPEGAGAGDALGQLLTQDGEIDAGK